MTADNILNRTAELISSGELAKAQKTVNAGLIENPEHAQMCFVAAALAAQFEDFETAFSLYERALTLEPDLQIVRFQYGLLLTTLQNEKGVEILSSIPDEESYISYFAQGLLALLQEDFQRARELILSGLETNGENPSLNSDMKSMLSRLDDHLTSDDVDTNASNTNSVNQTAQSESPEEETEGQSHLLDIYKFRRDIEQ